LKCNGKLGKKKEECGTSNNFYKFKINIKILKIKDIRQEDCEEIGVERLR
jgi:hypothetical protein